MGRNPVPTVAAEPDCVVKGTPILTLVRMATRRAIPGEVRLRLRPRPVPAVLLQEPVTKPRHIPTATTSKVCSCGAASGTWYSCRAKTCSDGGYVSSCPRGQTGTAVSYAGLTCYTNCKAQCSSSYRFSCSGNCEFGSGTSCDGLYQRCGCDCAGWNYTSFWNGSECEIEYLSDCDMYGTNC